MILKRRYFIDRLGASQVAALFVDATDLPTDLIATAYTKLEGAWKFELGKELRAAGYDVDLNDLAEQLRATEFGNRPSILQSAACCVKCSSMPIVLTFDIEGAGPQERNRIQSFFERFGWQNLGGSSYRYPRLGSDQPVEDWLNHVVPALMLFRAYLRSSGRRLAKLTLDCQSSSGVDAATGYGNQALGAAGVTFYPPSNQAFGAANLRAWLDGVTYPYP